MQGSPRIDELRQKFHENPRRYFAPLANEYRKAGDPEQAIAICRAHLAQQPGHMSGHVVYGQALYDARRPEEARSVFEKALSLDPDNAIVLKQLGDIAREKGESAEARHWYGKALDIDPMDSEVAAYIAELTEPLTGDAEPSAVAESAVEAEPAVEADEPIEVKRDVLEEVEIEAQQGIEAASPADDQGDGFEEPVEEPAEEAPAAVADAAETESTFVMADGAAESGGDEADGEELAATIDLQPAEDAAADPVDDDAASAEDAVPAPVEDVAWRNTPEAEKSPFVTRTMAELYASQGYPDAALDIYRQLAIQHPDDMEIRDRIDELSSSGPELSEPFSFAELTDDVIYEPTSEDTSLTGDGPPSIEGVHFTEMALGEGGGAEAGFSGSEFTEVTEVSWDGSLADFSEISLDDPGDSVAAGEPSPVLESTAEPVVEPVVEEVVSESDLETFSSEIEPVDEDVAVAADTAESDAPVDAPVEEVASEARFVELPVALGEVQTSIDEAGMATTSPHDSEVIREVGPEPEAHAEVEVEVEVEVEAEAEDEAETEPAPDSADDEWGADDLEAIESEVVAYSPELPAPEDIPHYTPKAPTIREFFATLGARRPPDRGAAESFTARAAIPQAAPELPADDLPLATEAFDSLFPDDPPVSEEDTRAAFALSGALSGATHNPVPSSLRTSPPLPTPAVTEPSAEAKESEEDIRRFREWLDGLADS